MKKSLAAMVMILVCVAHGQRVVTTTRLVALFSNLENEMMTAAARQQAAGLERLLSSDFEVWTPQPPGAPMPREDWLRTASAQLASFRVRQMAVRDLGQHAVVDFVLTAGTKNYFVVDIWKRVGDGWQLMERYQSEVQGIKFPEPRPTGKE